jgi:3-hydroxyisobutyrate dehydrogenase-like beta-hydroxyacid dehydrogenase
MYAAWYGKESRNGISFIGLGIMGKPMAKNLISAVYELVVHDVDPQAVQKLVAEGADKPLSPQEASEYRQG